ncbi:hypothetical protein BC829DRAFT_397998 [Chytridium lagenaria]|nr:hypothetical protein BC829DRAFT_397998 [Chytridium lagenaria]
MRSIAIFSITTFLIASAIAQTTTAPPSILSGIGLTIPDSCGHLLSFPNILNSLNSNSSPSICSDSTQVNSLTTCLRGCSSTSTSDICVIAPLLSTALQPTATTSAKVAAVTTSTKSSSALATGLGPWGTVLVGVAVAGLCLVLLFFFERAVD